MIQSKGEIARKDRRELMERKPGLGFVERDVRDAKKKKRRRREAERSKRRNRGERSPEAFSLFQAFAMEKESEGDEGLFQSTGYTSWKIISVKE